MIIENKIELLSPAGSFECAKAAIVSGADAIYMGGAKFGARAFAKSVDEDKIIDSIKLTHSAGKKFYLTVNTLFKQKELKEIFLYLDNLVEVGIDAFILQDLGVSMMLKERYPNVELHASTQMTITSSKAVKLVKSLGFSQVVLARELSIKEIKEIKKEVGNDIKLEAFVHGSMCYSYSGACLMSSFIGGESGNRGRCKGPCRLQYDIANATKNKAPYILSMKDMCALNSLSGLVNAGVTSFKIEGRMRQADYVEGVTKTYRRYIDEILDIRKKNGNVNKEIIPFDNSNEKLSNDDCLEKSDGSVEENDILKRSNDSIRENDILKKSNDSIRENDILNDEKYLLKLYNKGGFTNYYDKHNGSEMIQRYERK